MAFFEKNKKNISKKDNGKEKDKEEQVVQKKKVKVPKTVQQSIPYVGIYPNGVIETDPGTYSKSYSFTDINFADATEDDQWGMKEAWGKILNIFSPDMNVQLNIFNRAIDEGKVYNEVLVKPQPDNYNALRDEMNEIIKDAMQEGRNNLECEKYLTVSFKSNSIKEAFKTFTRLDSQIERGLQAINENIEQAPISLSDRLSILYDIYNPYNKLSFKRIAGQASDQTGAFDIDTLKKSGISSKDLIGPEVIKFRNNHIELGEKVARTLYIDNIPNVMTSDFLSDLANQECSSLTSVHYKRLDAKKASFMIRNKMTDINKDIIKLQKTAAADGVSSSLISPVLQQTQLDGAELMEEIMHNDQNIFLVTITITLFADDLESLDHCTETVKNVVARYVCDAKVFLGQQEVAFNTTLPLANNKVYVDRLATTDSASILLPFSTQDICHKDGVFFGKNSVSKNIIRINQTVFDNMNGMFLGKPGSGKSMQAKWDIISKMLTTDDDIFIIDPEDEYRRIAALFPDDAEVIDLMPGATAFINPLDLDTEYAGTADPIAMKISFLEGFMNMVYGKDYVLTPTQKSILARCAETLYSQYMAHLRQKGALEGKKIACDYSAAPTLIDLYDLLFKQPQPEAAQMALALEKHCSGANAIFAHKTNINPKKRLLIYNIKDLGDDLKEIGLFTCLNDAWNRMIVNSRTGKITNIYIDEFHLIIPIPSAISLALSMWKRVRKFSGGMKGITQNITDMFSNDEAIKILSNSNFVVMMNQSTYDRELLAKQFFLSDSEKMHITNCSKGSGLIFAGKSIYPFENTIPKDSSFYKAMSTNNKEKREGIA